MYDLSAELKSNTAMIERALDALLTVDGLGGKRQQPERLVAAMRHGTLNGGKRLRPLLVRQTAGIFGVRPDQAVEAGIAVELIHCYSLIHDDLPAMDDDDLRRGRPTLHKAFDEATAILAGDALLTEAFRVLTRDQGQRRTSKESRIVAELAEGAAAMVGGQMRDIEGETRTLQEAEIAFMQAMKTGALIRAAVRMGAVLGDARYDEIEVLTGYAEKAGEAYQLADDILDVTASPEAMGKATGKDFGAGKQTLVTRIGVDAARRRLADLVHGALTALTPFGPEADGLRATARYFATRES